MKHTTNVAKEAAVNGAVRPRWRRTRKFAVQLGARRRRPWRMSAPPSARRSWRRSRAPRGNGAPGGGRRRGNGGGGRGGARPRGGRGEWWRAPGGGGRGGLRRPPRTRRRRGLMETINGCEAALEAAKAEGQHCEGRSPRRRRRRRPRPPWQELRTQLADTVGEKEDVCERPGSVREAHDTQARSRRSGLEGVRRRGRGRAGAGGDSCTALLHGAQKVTEARTRLPRRGACLLAEACGGARSRAVAAVAGAAGGAPTAAVTPIHPVPSPRRPTTCRRSRWEEERVGLGARSRLSRPSRPGTGQRTQSPWHTRAGDDAPRAGGTPRAGGSASGGSAHSSASGAEHAGKGRAAGEC